MKSPTEERTSASAKSIRAASISDTEILRRSANVISASFALPPASWVRAQKQTVVHVVGEEFPKLAVLFDGLRSFFQKFVGAGLDQKTLFAGEL